MNVPPTMLPTSTATTDHQKLLPTTIANAPKIALPMLRLPENQTVNRSRALPCR